MVQVIESLLLSRIKNKKQHYGKLHNNLNIDGLSLSKSKIVHL